MSRSLRFAKRLALPALLAGGLLVLAQVVFATPPIASFTADVTAGAPGCGSVTFTSTSTDAESDIQTIDWDFGDGTTGSGSPVTHQYATPGPFTVNMTATDADAGGDGIESDTATQQVQIPNTAPTAGFGVSANPQAGQPITFTSTSTDTGTITGYAWDFGDGSNGTGAAPTHTFADHTTHSVSLVATDNCGVQSAAAATEVTPGNTAPAISTPPSATVGGVAATAVNRGEAVTFSAAATDANGDTPTYTWNFGDGTTGTGATVQHTYAAALAATSVDATVTVTDGFGGSTPSTALALRINQPPVPELVNDPESPQVGETVNFNAGLSHDADASPGALTYAWDLDGDGAYDDATGPTATRQFNTVGDATVGVQVTDGDGLAAVLNKTIKVQKTRPRASLRYTPQYPVPGQTVTLTSTSTKSPSAGSPPIALTQWDFDYPLTGSFGPMASGASATTSFATAGVHIVAVRVTDGSGGTDIANVPIVVNAKPKAAFTFRPAKPHEGDTISFVSTSRDPDGPIAKQEWDLDNDGRFDDGGAVIGTTRKLKKGTRTVRLRVTDNKGATDTIAQKIRVRAKPPGDAPDVVSSLGFAPRAWGVQLVSLNVSVPGHTTVKIVCKGRGCPRGKFTKRSRKKSTELHFTKFHGLLRAGTKVTIVSSREGSIAEYFTWTVRGNYKSPLKKRRCKAPGSKTYRHCR
jgi:PKD repeat protein